MPALPSRNQRDVRGAEYGGREAEARFCASGGSVSLEGGELEASRGWSFQQVIMVSHRQVGLEDHTRVYLRTEALIKKRFETGAATGKLDSSLEQALQDPRADNEKQK